MNFRACSCNGFRDRTGNIIQPSSHGHRNGGVCEWIFKRNEKINYINYLPSQQAVRHILGLIISLATRVVIREVIKYLLVISHPLFQFLCDVEIFGKTSAGTSKTVQLQHIIITITLGVKVEQIKVIIRPFTVSITLLSFESMSRWVRLL